MKNLPTLLMLVLLTACSVGLKESEKTIESANAAYNQFDLEQSHKILEAVLSIDTLPNKQKCIALRKLAHQDWKYYKDYKLAKKRLIKADSIGDSRFDTWMLMSRIERESQNYNDALKAAIQSKALATSQSEMNKSKIEYAQIVYDLSVNNIKKGNPVDKGLLMETSELLSGLLATDAGIPKPSKLLLGIALLNNNGENVLKAWQSYFQIQDIENTYPYLSASAEQLKQVCNTWDGNNLTVADQEVLIEALASSRFYELIPVYAKIQGNESNFSQRTKDIISYSNYLEEVKKETNEYYRLIAIEQENEKAYKDWLSNKREELWNQLSFTAQKEYSESDFLNATEKHYGARGFTGGTSNHNGYVLCLGHIVNQDKAKVEQYGYQPEFTYTQIDMMASNGYSSWFWEDKAIGGWATDNEIIRVREVYLNGPFKAWKTLTDTIERKRTEKVIDDFLANSSANQLELSDGLTTKLKFDALKDLYDELSSKGLNGPELKLAFLSKYEQFRTEASLLAHEGRHSIEKKYMPEEFSKWNNEEREYHAKLSQIVFATEPRLELAGMVGESNGNSGHAKANKRIVDAAIAWIEGNKETIAEYSESRPAYAQIYLMTNNQIRECYKHADPMYE